MIILIGFCCMCLINFFSAKENRKRKQKILKLCVNKMFALPISINSAAIPNSLESADAVQNSKDSKT